MSIQKKSAKSILKKDLVNSKLPTLGVKKLMFAHKATAGETSIDLNSLTVPPEFTALGFSPSPTSELLAARMYFFRKNLRLHSLEKGELVDYIDYTVDSNSKISFTETFGSTIADDIIVGWIDPVVKSGNLVADTDSVVVTGTLTAGQTQINIGKAKQIINLSHQLGSVEVQIEGQTLRRNVANDAASPTAAGDYEEVDNGSGYFTIIELNTPATGGETYIVKSTAIDVLRPDGSVFDSLEVQQGVVDKLVETTAALAGVPETDFQASPTQPQLTQFGDRLLAAESDVSNLQADPPVGTNWYEEFTGTMNWVTNPVSEASPASTFKIVKVGNMVSFFLYGFIGTGDANNAYISTGDIPAAYQPKAHIDLPIMNISNNVGGIGICRIKNNGTIEMYRDAAFNPYQSGGNAEGFRGFSASWLLT